MRARFLAAIAAAVAMLCLVMTGSAPRASAATPAGELSKLAMPAPAAAVRLGPPQNGAKPGLSESSTLLLVGSALLGFGLVGRKRRS